MSKHKLYSATMAVIACFCCWPEGVKKKKAPEPPQAKLSSVKSCLRPEMEAPWIIETNAAEFRHQQRWFSAIVSAERWKAAEHRLHRMLKTMLPTCSRFTEER